MEKEFSNIRQLIEEHLSSINENTAEIQALFDYMQELESKVELVSQRLDQIELNQTRQKVRNIAPLNITEKKIFLVFYTEEMPLSYKEITEKTSIPIGMIPEAISSLMNKGIPFLRTSVNNQVFLRLHPQFKEIQAKENIVNLSLNSFLK